MIVVSDTSPSATLLHIVRVDLLLIDEKEGREVAKREGLRFIEWTAVLVGAKQRGLIPLLRDFLRELEGMAEFFISSKAKEMALAPAGEL